MPAAGSSLWLDYHSRPSPHFKSAASTGACNPPNGPPPHCWPCPWPCAMAGPFSRTCWPWASFFSRWRWKINPTIKNHFTDDSIFFFTCWPWPPRSHWPRCSSPGLHFIKSQPRGRIVNRSSNGLLNPVSSSHPPWAGMPGVCGSKAAMRPQVNRPTGLPIG